MLDFRKRTEPSPITQFTPPVWNENGSSFGPQLLRVQGQLEGPPIGVAFWLMPAVRSPVELLGPETPLVPASGSAQAYMRRAFELDEPWTPSKIGDGRAE